jgi:Zn-dependent protease/CBS domain-containing protein
MTAAKDDAETEPRSAWALRLGSVAGVPIRVHVTFLLLLVWVAWGASRAGESVGMQVALVLSVFACIVLHELGHVLVARRFGIGTRDITLYAIGGVSALKRLGEPAQELWISLAGPFVSLAIAGVLALGLHLSGNPVRWQALAELDGTLLETLVAANLVLAVFNLLPAFPMDGGRVLRSALALRMGKGRATRIAARVGQGLAIALGILGLYANVLLVVVAIFVFLGAQAEAGMQAAIDAVRGFTAGEAMVTRLDVVASSESLGAVAERLLRTEQQDYPVLDAGELRGVLTRSALIEGLAAHGREARVSDARVAAARRVSPDTPLERLLEPSAPGARDVPVLVMDGDRLAGMVTRENLTEFLALARARAVQYPLR